MKIQTITPHPSIRPKQSIAVSPVLRFGNDAFKSTTVRTADLFARALKNEGVTCIYGVPGEETLDLLDAFRKEGIQFITTRDEEGAAFMAATYGRLTGKPGVCLATLGPGATKFSTPAAYATLGGMPLILITGQKPFRNNNQARFQMLDIVRMMEPLTKSTRRITEGSKVPQIVRESFQMAMSERPGSVHLELPEDVAEEPVSASIPLFPVTRVQPAVADNDTLHRAAEKIARAKRPVLVIGAGAKRTECTRALKNFVDKTGIPFISTQLGKGAIDETHPRYLGTAAMSSGNVLHDILKESDLVITVGNELEEKPPFLMRQGQQQEVIHISANHTQADPVYFPQTEVIGEIANTLDRISSDLAPVSTRRWRDAIKAFVFREPKPNYVGVPAYDQNFYSRAIDKAHSALKADNDSAFPLSPLRVIQDIQKALPEDGMVTLDNGLYKIWFARHFKSRRPDSLLLDNALATMGAGLPSAMEAARLYPNRKVIAVCGDGGFMMNSQELETAIREKLNLTLLILNDGGYGMIRWKQQGQGLPDYALQFGNPDFSALAKAYGAQGHVVTSADELLPLLKKTTSTPGVHVVEVPFSYPPTT